MAREAVAPILEKDFIGLNIDIVRMTGGRELKNRLTEGRREGDPWLAILNPDGSIVVHSTGPDGNIGSPYYDHEIAYFKVMMEKAARNMTASDIEILVKEFVAAREEGPGLF